MYNGLVKPIEIAVLVNPCNKYKPGVQEFNIPALVNAEAERTISNSTSNIANKDKSLSISSTTYGGTITLTLPKEFTRNYPTKVVPAGTKFLVAFIGEDITNPKIVGRYQ